MVCSARCRKRLERARKALAHEAQAVNGAVHSVARTTEHILENLEHDLSPTIATEGGYVATPSMAGPTPLSSPDASVTPPLIPGYNSKDTPQPLTNVIGSDNLTELAPPIAPSPAPEVPAANLAPMTTPENIVDLPPPNLASVPHSAGDIFNPDSSGPVQTPSQEDSLSSSSTNPASSVLTSTAVPIAEVPVSAIPGLISGTHSAMLPEDKPFSARSALRGLNLLYPATVLLFTIVGLGAIIFVTNFLKHQTPTTSLQSQKSVAANVQQATANTPFDTTPQNSIVQLNRNTVISGGNSFTATGAVVIQNEADSTNAFRIQDAKGDNLLSVDTKNQKVGIGITPAATGGALQVAGDINATGTISSKGTVLSSGGLSANNGATLVSNSGLTINSVLICTAAGCKPDGLVFQGDATTLSGKTSGFYTNASNINGGTLGDQFLTTNVNLLDANQTVTGNKTFTGINSFTAAGNTFTGDGSGLSALDASNIATGTLDDARLSTNVALLNGNNVFSGNNTFNGLTIQNGNFRFQSATNAVGAFQVQNAAGNDNLLVADTINTRIGIGVAVPNYTLDVDGDINVSSGHTFRINGASVCDGGLCNPSGGSSFYINNSTSAQASANFNIQSSSNTAVGGIIQGASGQTADLFEGQNSAGAIVYALDPQGNVNITGQYKINGAPICTSSGCTAASGSGNYIQNGISLQTAANFNIESASTSNVVAILKGKSGQTADLLEAKDGNGSLAFSVGSQGAVLSKDTSGGSHTFFQVQGSNFVNNLLTADTITGQILLPNANVSSTALLFAGNANLYAPTNNNLKTDNNLTISGNLTVNGTGLFKNTADSTTAFQVQRVSGTTLLGVDTTNAQINIGGRTRFSGGDGIYFDQAGNTSIVHSSSTGSLILLSQGGLFVENSSQNIRISVTGDEIRTGQNLSLGSNFNLQAVSTGVGEVPFGIGGVAGQTVDLMDIYDTPSGNKLVSVSSTGKATFKNSANSTGAFQIQNAAGTALLTADTSNLKVSTTQLQASSTIASTSGTANAQLSWNYQASTGLTMSGNEITDTTRTANTQGDGLTPPDSSTGIWEATTNLITNGGFESNTTGWSPGTDNTLTSSSDVAKFGSKSLKYVTGTANSNSRATISIAVTASTTYTYSAWIYRTDTVPLLLSVRNQANDTFIATQTIPTTPLNAWQRVTITFTATATENERFSIEKNNSLLTTTTYLDGVQLEQKAYATPYVETNGSTASRNAGSAAASASLLNVTQGWAAVCYRIDTAGGSSGGLFSLDNGALAHSLQIYHRDNGSGGQIYQANQDNSGINNNNNAFSVGQKDTIIMYWTATTLGLSINGGAFQTTSRTIDSFTPTELTIGTAVSQGAADGDIMWFASGIGTLTNADATALNNYGNTDPLLSNLTTLNSGSATPTMVWNGVNSNYNTTSGIAQSQLTLDDVNLYHSASGSVALQGATNSTTAFQVQNAGSTSVLDVDTANGRVGIGTSAPAAALDIIATPRTGNDGWGTGTAGGLHVQYGHDMGTQQSGVENYSLDQPILTLSTPNGAIGQSSGINTALQLQGEPWGFGSGDGIAISFGPVQRSSRIIHYGNNANNAGSRLQLQTHSASDGNLWNAGLEVWENGSVTVGSNNGGNASNPITSASLALYGQGSDIQDWLNSSSVVVGSVNSSGAVLFKNSTNSTTAFQVQNASGASVFTLDTTDGYVALGSGATPANSTLTVGTNTTTAAGGITFGTDTNLYRSAANTLKTDDGLVAGIGLAVGTSTPDSVQGRIKFSGDLVSTGSPASGKYIVLQGNSTSSSDTWGMWSEYTQIASASSVRGFEDTPTLSGAISITNRYGVLIDAPTKTGGATLANNYAIKISDQTGGGSSSNYGIYFAGGGTANSISWAGDTNLYRSAANTLKTDSNLIVGNGPSAVLSADTSNLKANVTNLQASGTIALQGADGGSILLRTSANSGTGSNAMTFSGNEITDATRSAGTQGDGRAAPDSSTGVWEPTTNLVTNGGFESNTTGWSMTGTITRDTTKSKFGSASLKAVYNGTVNNLTATVASITSGQQYTASAWYYIPSGQSGVSQFQIALSGTGFSPSASSTITPVYNQWTRITLTATATATGSANLFFRLYPDVADANGNLFYLDGAQVEQKAYATPYVETNGATATRNAATVTAPSTGLSATQGWVSFRIRADVNFSSFTNIRRLFDWDAGNGNDLDIFYQNSNNTFKLDKNGVGIASSAITPAAGDFVTVTAYWTSGQIAISINGGNFSTQSNAAIPSGLPATFALGSLNQLDSDIIWAAAGTGTFTNSDATNLYNLGNSDPSVSSLNSIDSSSTPTFAWDGESTQYSGTNNDPTLQSGISIDDVNLYHSANGSITIQGATNSTTAFQVQNVSGSSVLTVDTTNNAVGIGTAPMPGTGTLAVGGSITTSSYNQFIGYIGHTDIQYGSTLLFRTAGVGQASIASGGATTFKNSTNSSAAFQIQNASSQNLLQVDTANNNITLNGLNSGQLGAWQTNTNALPNALSQQLSVVANGYIYEIGGQNAATGSSSVYYAPINSNGSVGTWNTTTSLPYQIETGTATVANGYVYIVGGYSASTTQAPVLYAKLNANGTVGTWNTTTSLPQALGALTSVVANGYIYAIGGQTASCPCDDVSTIYYAQLNANGTIGSWQTNANALPQARGGQSAVVANGYVYVLGGSNTGGANTSTIYYAQLNSNGSTGMWSTNANALPNSLSNASAVVANGYVYFMGGTGGPQSTVYYAALNSNGSTGAWSTNANALPQTLWNQASVVYNGYVYVVGGQPGASTAAVSTVYYASTARIQLGGSIDLVGLSGQTLTSPGGNEGTGSTGGSITAGDITAVGNLQVQGQGNFAQGINVAGNFTNTGSANFQNSTNSTTAFQINNSSGSQVLGVDTANQAVNVTNLQSSGIISLQGPDGGSILLRTAANSGTGSNAMTFSGNEITDATRSAGNQGDGRATPDSSTGVWESTTNLIKNGGAETNTNNVSHSGASTLTSDATKAKFGSHSFKMVTDTGTYGETVAYTDSSNSGGNNHIAVSPSTTYTFSIWINSAVSQTVTLGLIEYDSAGTTQEAATTKNLVGNGAWQRATLTVTTQSTTGTITPEVFVAGNVNVTYYVDGAQLEQKAYATPYVETNGATATRNAAGLQAPSAVLSPTQSWIALRVRMNVPSSSFSAYSMGLFGWMNNDNPASANQDYELTWTGSQFYFRSYNGADEGPRISTAFSAGDTLTLIFAWTSTSIQGSLNGSNFVNTTRTGTIPNSLLSHFNIGSRGASSFLSDSDILWTATGTGTLSNADAAALNAYGNSDPTISSLSAVDSAAAPTYAWDGEGAQYSGTNNDPIPQSSLSIDDVSLSHSGNGSLTLQGSVNSTNALQIQNASGTALFTADTSGMGITIGGTLTVAGNLTLNTGYLITSSSSMYTTTLPVSPVNGQEIYYEADSTHGVVWHLRYNSSESTYHWEYLGGSPLYSEVDTAESTSSSSYTALTTGGPSITLPLGGDYDIKIESTISFPNANSGSIAAMSYSLNGGAASDVNAAQFVGSNSGGFGGYNGVGTVSAQRRITGRSANDTVVSQYKSNGNSATFSDRVMIITPVRVQ